MLYSFYILASPPPLNLYFTFMLYSFYILASPPYHPVVIIIALTRSYRLPSEGGRSSGSPGGETGVKERRTKILDLFKKEG
jgi:hypothetical protein